MKKLLFILMVCTALTGCSNTNVEDKISNETAKALAVLNAPEELVIDENFDVNSILSEVQEGVEATYKVDEENSKIIITLTQGEQVETLEAPIMLASIEEPAETPAEPVETPAETVSNFPCTCVGTIDDTGENVSFIRYVFNEDDTINVTSDPYEEYHYEAVYNYSGDAMKINENSVTSLGEYEFRETSPYLSAAGTVVWTEYKCDKPHPFQ